MPVDEFSVENEVNGQPFCAGVYVERGSRILLTLGDEDRWKAYGKEYLIPAAWIGGGQKDSKETVLECALREGREELGCELQLLSSEATLLISHKHTCKTVRSTDAIRPAIVEIRPGLSTPYAPGLPTGPALFVVIYRAKLLESPAPLDVPGILTVNKVKLNSLLRGTLLSRLHSRGIETKVRSKLPPNCMIQLPTEGPEDLLRILISYDAKHSKSKLRTPVKSKSH